MNLILASAILKADKSSQYQLSFQTSNSSMEFFLRDFCISVYPIEIYGSWFVHVALHNIFQ